MSSPAPVDFESAPVAAELDVRPMLRRGEEPFRAIMAAAASVPTGQALRLRATFEPAPLYTVLGKRGFAHRARQLGPDDWEVLFVKTDQPSDDQSTPAKPAAQADAAPPADGWASPAEVVTIDVSDLVPPEPMVRILEAAGRLQPGQALLVHHQRRPVYLYPRLDELGFEHETRELPSGQVEILIRRPAAG